MDKQKECPITSDTARSYTTNKFAGLQHLIVGHSDLPRTRHCGSRPTDLRHLTVELLALTSDNVPLIAVLKNNCGLSSGGVGARCFLGQSPASFWVGRPCGGGPLTVPALPQCRWYGHQYRASRDTWDFALPGARRWVSWLENASSAP